MNKKFIKLLVFSLLLIFYGSFLVYKISLPVAQDLPRQMQNGSDVLQGNYDVLTKNVYSYTEPDQPFANHHWLYGVFAYLLYLGVGWNGMVIFKVIFLLLMFALLFYTAQKNRDFWFVAMLSIPTILILINRTALRPEMFSFLFVSVFLYFLTDLQENPEHKRVFWLIPLQLIWVNTHLFFPVGIMMTFGMLIQNIVLHRKNILGTPIIKKLFLLVLLLIVMTFINPFGLWGIVFSLLVNTSSSFPISSAEITPIFTAQNLAPGWDNISATVFFPSGVFLFISFIIALIYRWKTKKYLFANNYIFFLLASIGSAALPFVIIRGMPLFALIFLPAVVSNLNEPFILCKNYFKTKFSSLKKIFENVYIMGFIFLIIMLIVLGQKKVMASVEEGVGLTRYAVDSIKFFKDNNLKGPIFNDTDIGSYLIGELYPQEKVFSDNRFGDAYSESFFNEIYLPMIRNEDRWKEALLKYKFNTIFFYHYDAVDGGRDFLFRRVYDPEWAWVYADNSVMIFVKKNKENQEVIEKFQITSENMADRLKFLLYSKNSEDILTGADLFNLVGKIDVSTQIYLKFASQTPSRGKVWMVLGRTELTKADQAHSDPYLAAVFLERALKEGWKTWEAYSFLALAYFRTGQLERAKEMVQQELRVAPDSPDAHKWLGVIADEEMKQKNAKSEQ